MPVSACAAKRNLSKCGPHRNILGIEAAEKLIFVQQNDPATYAEREREVMIE